MIYSHNSRDLHKETAAVSFVIHYGLVQTPLALNL